VQVLSSLISPVQTQHQLPLCQLCQPVQAEVVTAEGILEQGVTTTATGIAPTAEAIAPTVEGIAPTAEGNTTTAKGITAESIKGEGIVPTAEDITTTATGIDWTPSFWSLQSLFSKNTRYDLAGLSYPYLLVG
jgi:hypothetical protein